LKTIHLPIDPLLSTFPHNVKNLIILCYTVSLLQGNTIHCKSIKAATIKRYISAISKLHKEAGLLDPCNDFKNERLTLLTSMLNEAARWETMADRREPVTWDMVELQTHNAKNNHPDSLEAAMSDWLTLGMYGGFRLSEWAQPASKKGKVQLNRDGSPTAFIKSDLIEEKQNTYNIHFRFQKIITMEKKSPFQERAIQHAVQSRL
jgi:hypothetical protein